MKTQLTIPYLYSLFSMLLVTSIQAQDNWEQKFPSLSPPQMGGNAMAYAGDDKVMIFGGYNFDNEFLATDQQWIYDLSENEWIELLPSLKPPVRSNHGLCPLGGDKFLLYGGTTSNNGGTYHTDTWIYDLSDNTWSEMFPPDNPGTVYNPSLDYAGDDKAILLRGSYPNNQTWIYDLSENTWTMVASTTFTVFSGDFVAYMGEDHVLFLSMDMDPLTYLYDVSDNEWTLLNTSPLLPFIFNSSMAFIGGDRVVLFGGDLVYEGISMNTTWMFDLSENEWNPMTPPSAPSERSGHAMAFIANNTVVTFGGFHFSPYMGFANDTWVYALGADEPPVFTSCPTSVTLGTRITGGCWEDSGGYSIVATGTPGPTFSFEFTGANTFSGSGLGIGIPLNAGTTNVTIYATNSAGVATCTFPLNIVDPYSPAISGCPNNMTIISETGQWGAHGFWAEPTASDNCQVESLVSSHASGSFFNVGTTTVTYTAEDIYGNTSACQFLVTVNPPDLLGKVNTSIFVDDISFSNNHPEINSSVNISAVVHNTSNVDASGFEVKLKDLFSNTSYASIPITSLEANHSTQVNWIINTPAVAAFMPIQVTVDALDNLDESNELDNVAVKPLIVGTLESLGTMGVGTNPVPASVYAGSVIQLCGSASYEDVTPPLADPSVAGAAITITIVETGESFSGYTDEAGNFCIPYGTPNTPGLYHYIVEITDNTLSGDAEGSFTTTTPPPPPCNKDLAVSIELTGIPYVGSNTYETVAGNGFTGTIHVSNGCQAVSQSTTLFVGLSIGSPVPSSVSIPALAPGETYHVALPAITFSAAGTGYISATVDYYNEVPESDEGNNTDHKTLRVLPLLPDLAVLGGSILSEDVCATGNQATFHVKNLGTVPSGSYIVVFESYADHVLQNTQSNTQSSLSASATALITFLLTPSLSLDSFVFKVDDPDVIAEMSESNNRLSFPYVFKPCKSDLIVLGCEYLDVKPVNPSAGNTLTVDALIMNIGDLPVTIPFDVLFNIAGTTQVVSVNSTIASQQAILVTASGPAPAGPGSSVSVTVDSENEVTEKDDFNNAYSASLCQDFVFTNMDCGGDPIFEGTQYYCQQASFRIGLRNEGVYEASTVQVKFEISGPGLIGWVHLGTPATYMNTSCDCPSSIEMPNAFYFPQTGAYQVRMTLDPANLYAECNESNQEIVYDVNVVESADYKILSSYITPSDLNPDIGESVSFTVSYANTGCTGFSPIELYGQVDNAPLDSVQVAALSGGGFTSVAFSNTFASTIPGMHVFRAIIDHDNQINEGNENNNEATRAIIVGDAPDYNVLTITASSLIPSFGQLLTINTSVKNDGQSIGSGQLQFLYQEGDDPEVLIDQQTISILPGATTNYSIEWIAVAPYARLIARVINVTPVESDFSDNEKSVQLNPLSILSSSTDVNCAGLDLGSLSVTIVGGKSPYFTNWSNGMEEQKINVPAGTYVVTVTDAFGNEAIMHDTIVDLDIPSTWYHDADSDGFGNADVTEIACNAPADYVGTGTDCDDTHATVYPDATELPDGLDNDCDGQIDEGLSYLNIEAGDCELVYLGYEPAACHTLSVSVSGGATPYTYLWSNGATSQGTEVCPEETTIYTVKVTDHNGFTAMDQVTVQVIDIRCGNNNNKVLVCHIPPGNPENVQMICIAASAVQAHLDHGCYIGICDAQDPCEEEESSIAEDNQHGISFENQAEMHTYESTHEEDNDSFSIFPNPANDFIQIQLPASDDPFEIEVYDISGKLIENLHLPGGLQKLSTAAFHNGIYFITIQSVSERMTTSIVVLH